MAFKMPLGAIFLDPVVIADPAYSDPFTLVWNFQHELNTPFFFLKELAKPSIIHGSPLTVCTIYRKKTGSLSSTVTVMSKGNSTPLGLV